jgi:hypothetical protein
LKFSRISIKDFGGESRYIDIAFKEFPIAVKLDLRILTDIDLQQPVVYWNPDFKIFDNDISVPEVITTVQ